MGCGQSKTEKVTKETRTTVSQSPQRAEATTTQVEKTATTTTTTTTDTATNKTPGENADKKNVTGDVIMVGKHKNKTDANADTKEGDAKETTAEKHTAGDGKEVKEVHEKTKEVKTAATTTTTTTTTAAKKKKNTCEDEVIDKIKLSSPTVKKREEREAAAFAERMLEENGYLNDASAYVPYVDPTNAEQPIINEPCEVYISPDNNMTITPSSNNNINISQNAQPTEPSCDTSNSAPNSSSISPPPQPHEVATPCEEPLVRTNVIATREYEIDNGKSPEPVPQKAAPKHTDVHHENKMAHEHGEHHLHHTPPSHHQHTVENAETESSKQKHHNSIPRKGSGSTPDGARATSKTTGTHLTPRDKSSTVRSLAKLHTTATSRLAQQYADQQQQKRRSSSSSQPHDETRKTPSLKREKTKPTTKTVHTTTTTTNVTPPPVTAGDSEHQHPHSHHHHHDNNNVDKENHEVHHNSTHSATPEKDNKVITTETCVVKTTEMNGTMSQSDKFVSELEVTTLQQQQGEEKITMPEVVNDETNASENADGQSSGPETSTLRQLYNRIASFTRILPTTPSRSQSQAQADSEAAKQSVESEEQKKEEVVECQTEQPHPSHEPAAEHENERKHPHHHHKHDEQEKEKQQQLKQKEKEEEKKKKKKEEEKLKEEEEEEDEDQQPEPEQPPSHYWRHSQSITGPTSYTADHAPTLVKTANGTSKPTAASKEPIPTAAPAAPTSVTTNTMHNKPKPLSEAVEREKLRNMRRTRKTAAQKYNVLYNLENDAASTITAQSYRPKYNQLVRAQAMNSKGSMASQRSAELKESTFEKKLRQREAEAQAEASEQAKTFSPEAAVQPEEQPASPMWVTVIPQDDAAVNMSGGWGLLRQIRTLIQLSHTPAVEQS